MIPYNKRQDAQIIKIKDYINGKREYVTGEGTSLTLENTANTPFNNIILNGNTSQNTTTGKNLLPINAGTETINGVTLTPEYTQNGELKYLKINGTATSAITFNHSMNKDIKKGDYIFSVSDTELPFAFGIEITGATTFFPNTKKSWTFNNSSDGKITKWFINIPAGTYNDIKVYPMLRLQSITDATYEPYTNGVSPNPDYPQEIHCVKGNNVVKISSKNLFDESVKTGNVATSKNNIISDSNGVLEIQGVSNFYSGIFKTYKLKAKTQYTISLQCDFVGENSFSIIRYKLGNESEKISWTIFDGEFDVTPTNTIKSISFTTDSTGQVSIMFSCNGATNNGYVKYSHIQLEQNDTATNFVIPHSEEYPINLENYELNSISDFKDYFKKENGKWYKVEKIKSIIADGTNYLCKYMFPSGAFYIYSNAEKDSLRDAFKSSGLSLFSNYLISKTLTAVFNGEVGASCNTNTGEVYVNIGISTNKEDINTWLSTHNMIVKYILQTPNQIEITDNTLITQLDEISQALSQKGTTIISQNNDDLPFNLDVIALTK